jgi:poly(ADP-ribose) glycohydrolase ARH3
MSTVCGSAKFIDIARGCLIGVAIGDTYGLARERGGGVTGRYSDDTQMTIGLAEALTAEGADAGPDVLARYFAEHYQHDRHYGGSVNRILQDIRSGMEWHVAVAKNKPPGGSWGNGAAMRVAPIALLHHDSRWVDEKARRQCAATGHTHPDALLFAAAQARAVSKVARMRHGVNSVHDVIHLLTPESAASSEPAPLRWVAENLHARPEEVGAAIGCGLRASEAVPCALWAFLSGAKEGPMAVIERAISIGGDRDTIGAMAGALAGACFGLSGWPVDVVDSLENGDFGRDYILSLADDLADMAL